MHEFELFNGFLPPMQPDVPQAFINIFFMMNLFAPSTLVYAAILYSFGERDDAKAALESEHDRSEGLLLNILPLEIAERLKAKEEVIADTFEEATILFSDMVGFTAMSSTKAPADLVRCMNRYFSAFDALSEKYNVEKIKTIGDAYMAASGLPLVTPGHAKVMTAMALEMLQVSNQISQELGTGLKIRIGLCSGPVTAGVIGSKKFIYDVWGDTVNTASRMESTAQANTIQVSESTFLLIKDDFSTKLRGRMEIKGKGEMPIYLVQ